MQVDWELSQSLTSDGQGVRGVGIVDLADGKASASDPSSSSTNADMFRLVTGTQGGTMTQFGVPTATLEPFQFQHDNAVTAVVCAENSAILTGSKDAKIRVFDAATRSFQYALEGHEKPVTSLSTVGDFLVSGSWDGTAKIWNWKTKALIATLPDHENSVSVSVVAPSTETSNNNGVLQVVTGSAGMAQPDNRIRDHTVRLWNVNLSNSQVEKVFQIANDHEGPIRDVCVFSSDDGGRLLATCSNDGTVKVRSLETGVCQSTLLFVPPQQQQQQHPPMLLSLCCTTDGSLIASAEDGNVVAWDLASDGTVSGEPQSILHASCVWKVEALSNGDFLSASDDGTVRIFTRSTERKASQEEREAFANEASEAAAKKQGGPSPEEIAKLPLWERNNEKRGTSEGQVQVFQKNGIAIAAQWSVASQTWIEVGQVMGSNSGGGGEGEGVVDGVKYDHVLPVELESTTGEVVNLKIGYNTGENPFTAAQRFIDNNPILPQYHLSQIADYITQRTGASAPTLGPAGPQATTGVPVVSYEYLPAKHYLSFELSSKSASTTMEKMKGKLNEFGKLSESELSRVSTLMDTIAATSHYHSSKVDDLAILVDILNKLDASESFPALDLARLTALHPDAASKSESMWTQIFLKSIELVQVPASQLGEGPASNAIPMLSLRLFSNALKGGPAARKAVLALLNPILTNCVTPHIASGNKNIRLSLTTVFYNLACCAQMDKSSAASFPTPKLVDLMAQVLSNHTRFEEASIMRTLQGLGTLCLVLPEAKQAANALFLASKVEPAASPHSPKVKAAAKEVYNVLQ